MTRKSSIAVPAKPETSAFDRRTIELGFDLLEAALDDASVLEDIPDGATVIQLPADDPDYVERAIALGVEAVRAGRNVYFRHVGATEGNPSSQATA